MKLPPEFIQYLKNEIKHFNKELRDILELPNFTRLRNRIKKDKRDTNEMLYLYKEMSRTNEAIRAVKDRIRACQALAKKLTGKGLQRVTGIKRDISYD